MTRQEIVEYFLTKPFTKETYPFDEVTAVFKVGGKMYGLISDHESDRLTVNLKNTPDTNIALRDMYEEIIEGYHMNKTHWITVYCDRSLSDHMICKLIDESYDIVYKKLTKKLRTQLENEA